MGDKFAMPTYDILIHWKAVKWQMRLIRRYQSL